VDRAEAEVRGFWNSQQAAFGFFRSGFFNKPFCKGILGEKPWKARKKPQ
jgi:hypothetical protein